MIKTSLYDRKREIDNDLSIWDHIFDLAVKKANYNFTMENILGFFYGFFSHDKICENFFKGSGFLNGKVYEADLLAKDPSFIKLVQALIGTDSYSLFVIKYNFRKMKRVIPNPRDVYFVDFRIESITKYRSETALNIDDMETIQKENGIECLIYNKKNEKVMIVYHDEYGMVINLK